MMHVNLLPKVWIFGQNTAQSSPISPAEQALLNQLLDIETPSHISAWPFALGYWLIIALVITVSLSLLWYFLVYKPSVKYRNTALSTLKTLATNTDFSVQQKIHAINSLLKQSYLSAKKTDRKHIASLHSEDLYLYLDRFIESKNQYANKTMYAKWANLSYSGQTAIAGADTVVDELVTYTKLWIKKHTITASTEPEPEPEPSEVQSV